MLEEYMTVGDVAKILKVSKATVRRAIAAKRLEACRVGTQPQIRISREQLNRYLELSATAWRAESRALALSAGPPEEFCPADNALSKARTTPTVHEGFAGSRLRWRVIHADAISGLKTLESGSVNCIVSSPPYYWQRDYEVAGQIGHEQTVSQYVHVIRSVFREAYRVLSPDGVVFLNLGDTYYSAKGKPHGRDMKHSARQLSRRQLRAVDGPGLGVPRKSALGIPWRCALALQDDGWVLRSTIIWQRPAPMPEPTAHDRPWRTYEPIFLFAKQPRYWFNRHALNGDEDVWRISAHSRNPGAHFAPYPIELADRCVNAGCPPGGTVLDPFVGSGTTMLAALNRGMSAIGIDLKEQYCEFVKNRLHSTYPPHYDMVHRDQDLIAISTT